MIFQKVSAEITHKRGEQCGIAKMEDLGEDSNGSICIATQ